MKIAIVVGHSKYRQGALGDAGMTEFEFNSEFAKELVPILSEKTSHEYRIFYRESTPAGYSTKMKHLHKQIDEWGADISISLHFNASYRPASGHLVLYCSKAGKKLAQKLDTMFDTYLKNRDRNIEKRSRKQRGGGFLCLGKSVCLLVEPFFANHQSHYVKGTVGRVALITSYVEFFSSL